MAEAAKTEMMDAPRGEIQTPNRFGTPDLNDKGLWMVRRLRERYPHLQDRFIISWLGGLTAQNNYRFVHTKYAVALSEKRSEVLDSAPFVKVLFIITKDPKDKDQIDEAADLYADVTRWATDMGASRVTDLDKFSDVPKPVIQERLGGRLLIEDTMYIKTKK